jgi:proton-coupled amino acid transporter
MIGSAIFSFEGIGVVLPIIEVTENQKQFPTILIAVLLTNLILYTGFGEFCLFVYGSELEGKPLITMNLPYGPVVWVIKILFSINVIISMTLYAFPPNVIVESYIYKNMKPSNTKTWLINFQRAAVIAIAITICILLGDSLDKFNSLIGTFAATPVSFTVPCLMHMKLCNPTPL